MCGSLRGSVTFSLVLYVVCRDALVRGPVPQSRTSDAQTKWVSDESLPGPRRNPSDSFFVARPVEAQPKALPPAMSSMAASAPGFEPEAGIIMYYYDDNYFCYFCY